MGFEIRHRGGVATVYDADSGETMHPGTGPWAEATGLYVQGSGLAALLLEPFAEPVVVFDVGLGAAANALAALDCRRRLVAEARCVRPLTVVSFEHDLGALRLAIEQGEALRYPRGHEPALRALLAEGNWESEGVVWELRRGAFPVLIRQEPRRADVIFFDPFSPRANPDMWAVPVFESLYRCRRLQTPTRLLTYSSAYGSRAAMLLAGFFVGEGPRLAPRQHTTIASTRFPDLARPLTPTWLRRWRRQRDPWPPHTDPGAHRRIREALQAHEQWLQFGEEAPASGDKAPRPSRRSPARGPRPAAGSGAPHRRRRRR